MAGMKRFVTYIYSYEEKKKAGNTGFAKIEIRGDECRLEIHLREVYTKQGACRVYLFREDDGTIEGVSLGEMQLRNGAGDFGVAFRISKIRNTPFHFNDFEGIFLLGEDGRIFMSRWKEGAPLQVCAECFHEWEKKEEKAETTAGLSGSPVTAAETVQTQKPGNGSGNRADAAGTVQVQKSGRTSAETAQVHKAAGAADGGKPEDVPAQAASSTVIHFPKTEENVTVTELPVRNIFPRYDWEEIWKQLVANHPVSTPFSDRGIICAKIELKDIRELPKRYWYLGNNSFLLHGFFNYHYLVIGKIEEEEENRWFIGVPGIYQNQERVMAIIFGFPEFLPEPEENRFGYWYRFIED